MKARKGDNLVVMYNGAKLQIAPFSTVEIDAMIYTRQLEEGEDVGKSFEEIHDFLKKSTLSKAREKLATFADELKKAKERAGSR